MRERKETTNPPPDQVLLIRGGVLLHIEVDDSRLLPSAGEGCSVLLHLRLGTSSCLTFTESNTSAE